MQLSEVIPDTTVVACDTHISSPDAGIREMTGTFTEGTAVRPLIYLCGQVDGGDLERSQISAGLVEVVGPIRPTRGS